MNKTRKYFTIILALAALTALGISPIREQSPLTVAANQARLLETDLQTGGSKAYTVSSYNGLSTFFTIDLNTGQMTALNTFPEIKGVSAFVAAIDLEANRYFQPAFDNDFVQRMLVIDTISGDLISSAPFSANLSVMEYRDGFLYGVMYDSEMAGNVLVQVDPSTLNISTLVAIPEVMYISTGNSAIDDNYFVFEGSDAGDKIVIINLQTLEISTIPLSYPLVHFALSNNVLIGVTAYPNRLVRIDLLTGESEVLSEVTGIQSLYQAAALFDQTKGWYMFPVVNVENKQCLFIFDIETGALVFAPELVVATTNPISTANANTASFSGQLRSFEKGWSNYRSYLPFIVKQ
ncbi:hypothetical protein [uncultured Chloroflexus sp.]|uniref:DUF6923 family protein n=1 Tax=uncultured Chloroflexus sp. TaxID=214040 RepID=UPI002631AB08|nr:hypothetical protein [uncultured Chloroflexus sp.]